MTTMPWVQKYSPIEFKDVVGNTKTVQILSNLAHEQKGSMPHLLLCGPSGCGKTLCVDILCNSVIKENRESRILRLDSFHEREIDDVRTTIKNFARVRVKTEDNPRTEKVVVLDEADSMTPGAFQALRRIMDVHSSTTRFIIVCNNSTKIIEPIQIRCAILRFTKVDDGSVRSRMTAICDMTNSVVYTSEGIAAIASVADGDVRSAINSLGSTVSGFHKVTAENVYRTCDSPQSATILEIFQLLRKKKDYVQACLKLKELYCEEGYSALDIVSSFFKTVHKLDVEEGHRLEIAKVIGLTQARVLNGVSTYLQLAAMMWNIALTFGPEDQHIPDGDNF